VPSISVTLDALVNRDHRHVWTKRSRRDAVVLDDKERHDEDATAVRASLLARGA